MIDEIKLFMEAGFSIGQAVQCGTLNGARLLGIADLGLLAPHMPATFIAVKGDPGGFPDSLKEIQGIYVKGALCQPLFKP